MTITSAHRHRLTNASAVEPSFSPSGTRLLYRTTLPGDSGNAIGIINADGTNERQLPVDCGTAGCSHPTFTPDGTHVVAWCPNGVDLCVWTLNGALVRTIDLSHDKDPTNRSGLDFAVSPQGHRI